MWLFDYTEVIYLMGHEFLKYLSHRLQIEWMI